MPKRRLSLFLPTLAVAGSAFAAPAVTYDWSDTRTILQDYAGFEGTDQGWSGHLTTEAGDAPLFVNAVAVTTGAGFDPNVAFSTPGELAYYDYRTGQDGTYQLGTAIAADQSWDLRRFLRLDTSSGTAAALGLYDFTVSFLGGADADARDTIASFDFHVDVADRLDATTTATAGAISASQGVAHVGVALTNGGTRALETTTWFYSGRGFQQDPSDDDSPYLDGDFAGDWFAQTVAPGATRAGAHSDWRLNGISTVGTYVGAIGVLGGLHSGDEFRFVPQPAPTIDVQAVPEPASMAILGVGVLGLFRRGRSGARRPRR